MNENKTSLCSWRQCLTTRTTGSANFLLSLRVEPRVIDVQGDVTDISAVVTAAAGHLDLGCSRYTCFRIVSGQGENVRGQRLKYNNHEPFCDAVEWSSSKNDGEDFLTLVTAVTVVSMGLIGND